MPDMFSFLHFKDGSPSAPTKDKATYAGIVSSLPVLFHAIKTQNKLDV